MTKISFGDICAYAILPRVMPRLRELVPNVKLFAGMIANIFGNVGLLPAGHKYLNPNLYATFGIRDVMGAAANNLKIDLRHFDHILLYGAFLIGIILVTLQFILLIVMGSMSVAHAASIPFTGMFDTVNPEQDLAFLMLDKVFGIPGFFNSCYDPAVNAANAGGVCDGYITAAAYPTDIQRAMQSLFAFYSNGILVVAFFVVFYYLFAMLVETINTGHPFGKRFQTIYTPLRLVISIMLILPMAFGYNMGQYLTLSMAKWGSGFATNAWLVFNNVVTPNPLGLQPENLIGKPKEQDITGTLNFIYLAKSCKAAYEIKYGKVDLIQPYLIVDASSTSPSSSVAIGAATTYASALGTQNSSDIAITFGEKDNKYKEYAGLVKPYCGQIVIPTQAFNVDGIDTIYTVHFNAVRDLWYDNDLNAYGERMARIIKFWDDKATLPTTTTPWAADNEFMAGSQFYIDTRLKHQTAFAANLIGAINAVRTNPNAEVDMNQVILNAGWGGAGLWFNNVASFNGAMTDAVYVTPVPVRYPLVMEAVKKLRGKTEANISYKDRFSPEIGVIEGKPFSAKDFTQGAGLDNPETDLNIASMLNTVYQAVSDSEAAAKPSTTSTDNSSPLKTFVSFVLGSSGLFDMLGNDGVYPLAKLAMLGRSIIDKTIMMIGGGTLIMGLSGALSGLSGALGAAAGGAGGIMINLAMLALITGATLYYIIPLLPFMYFFFAVGRWVKTVFEAMVGVPLWALGHLRIGDGGMVGSAASVGYNLLLEIFLRPILILFGLLASLTIFAAMASILDTIWVMVVSNVGGFDMDNLVSYSSPSTIIETVREPIDELFFTVLYSIIVYMMALSSFKLIDAIPGGIMRYLGFGGRAFNDRTDASSIKGIMSEAIRQSGDEVKQASTTVAEISNSISGQVISAMRSKQK